MTLFSFCAIFSILTGLAMAQYPAEPAGLTVLRSKLQPEVIISYKQTYICETTPGVKSFGGYVHLPSSVLQNVGEYNISTFFWYFEARNNPKTAPLAIYLAGGPGESSTYAAMSSESGPCYVTPDGNSTTLNPWSFNNHVNMLYIDQPVQAGFSYDTLINGTFDVESGDVTPLSHIQNLPKQNATFGVGTYASQNPLTTTNTSVTSAKALWHFAQNWLTSFPEYKSTNGKISVWANSYGGYWAPAVVSHFHKELSAAQNQPSSPLHNFTLDTMGITNGCIDQLYHAPSYPQYAYNNTYGVEFIPKPVYEESIHNFTKTGGCRDLIIQCRELGLQGDPEWIGNNATVNEACTLATDYCFAYVVGAFDAITGRDVFDVAIQNFATCPFYLPVLRYLNQPLIQSSLGVPLNFTYDSSIITNDYSFNFASPALVGTGDSVRKSVADFEYALASGVKIALVFGDRDYRCNWLGAERTANAAAWAHQAQFQRAGYERIATNANYHGGVVKQYNTLSFSRVFDAGHAVSAYQPETVYRIFQRAMFDRDVATGNISVGKGYQTKGPENSFGWKNKLPVESPNTCMVEGQFQAVNVWGDL